MSSQPPKPLGLSVRDLLLELKRGSGGDSAVSDGKNYVLPAYNDILVQTCLDEMNGHLQELEDQVSTVTQRSKEKTPMSVRPSLLLQNAAIQRHKRCLLTYHQVRLNSIQDMYWQQGVASVNKAKADNNQNENLSPLEQEFQQEYHKLIQKYASSLDLDLHSLPTPPLPQDRVQVRVLRDDVFGEVGSMIALESGASVTFTKGSTHFLLFSDVEVFINDGYLALLEGEEQDM
ncbi:GINS protein PSF1 [Seminavis robusta]|uniref:GINS protein PSF1 n=1 Tax=Seminavis robusta TaxID=568900 RepID=A0A9N8H2V6_9STRA|nr:GINS protein PSF1 [Seminavis robusta]|eukprot:Sro25_g017150.1 GINS protein PSF1 (232) ;mRNA; r:124514-125209